MTDVKHRSASLSDLKDIWGLVKTISGDIPFDAASEAAQESVLSELMRCCTSELSPVAVGEGKSIVGALLVRRDDFEWGLRNAEVVHVSYAAVAPSHRDKGVLAAMLTELQARKVPVLVSVKNGNQLGLVDELKKLGFAQEATAESGWGDLYKWSPAPTTH